MLPLMRADCGGESAMIDSSSQLLLATGHIDTGFRSYRVSLCAAKITLEQRSNTGFGQFSDNTC
jgi:hypothetical protein